MERRGYADAQRTRTSRPRRRYTPRLPRAERREQILDAALTLIARDGFAVLTMERVAVEAKIAKSVVYAIFSDRSGLERALMRREQERAFALSAEVLEELATASDFFTGCAQALTRFLKGVSEQPDTWRLVLIPVDGMPTTTGEAIQAGRERWRVRIEPLAERLLESAGLAGLDPELAAHFARGNAEYFARLMLEQPDRFTPERLEAFAADLSARLLGLIAL